MEQCICETFPKPELSISFAFHFSWNNGRLVFLWCYYWKANVEQKDNTVISVLRSSSRGSWQHFWQKDSFSFSEARHNYPSWHLFLSICIIYFWYLALMLTSSSWLSSDVILCVQMRLNTNNLVVSMNSLT